MIKGSLSMRFHFIFAPFLLLLITSANSNINPTTTLRYLSTVCYGKCTSLYYRQSIFNGCFSTTNRQLCCVDYDLNEINCIPWCTDCCRNGRWNNDVCVCHLGYSMVGGKCTPVCSSCENGTCVAPNQCACHDGYNLVNNKCVSNCDPPCINGYCSKTGRCFCSKGFVKSENGTCEPFCNPLVIDVTNGKCVAPNILRCDEGFRFKFAVSGRRSCIARFSIRVESAFNNSCPLGYKRNARRCEPVCNPPCRNATCAAPNKCECLRGYEIFPSKDETHICKPTCVPSVVDCTFGTCIAPNACACHEGYRLTETDRFSYCELMDVESAIPECSKGYKLDEENQCKPVCESECSNGVCSAPNTCECNEGFTITVDGTCTFMCDSRCTKETGACIDSECKCKEGYGNIESKSFCSPIPQLCSGSECNDEYIYDENRESDLDI